RSPELLAMIEARAAFIHARLGADVGVRQLRKDEAGAHAQGPFALICIAGIVAPQFVSARSHQRSRLKDRSSRRLEWRSLGGRRRIGRPPGPTNLRGRTQFTVWAPRTPSVSAGSLAAPPRREARRRKSAASAKPPPR